MQKWFLIAAVALLASEACAADMLVIFGTHVSGPGKGFSIAHFDSDTGKLSVPQFALQTPGPAFFVIAPDGKHLYSCNSLNPNGTVSAYAIDAATAKISLINSRPSGGGDPSYISLDNDAKHVLVANYQGGSVA